MDAWIHKKYNLYIFVSNYQQIIMNNNPIAIPRSKPSELKYFYIIIICPTVFIISFDSM